MKYVACGSFVILALLMVAGNRVLAQGCSDAGFCSAGSLKSATGADSAMASNVSLKAIYGSGEEGVNVIQIVPEFNWQMNQRSSFQFTVPFTFTSGNLGSTSGPGDIILVYTYRLINATGNIFGLSAGTKLATGKTDLKDNSFYSLPMPYQTGLGTYDLILGASYQFDRWAAAAGYQRVLVNENENTFLHYPFVDDEEGGYFISNKLDRGDDALLRLNYNAKIGDVTFTPGLLAIYRLNKDQVTGVNGEEFDLKGSDGLTLNITLTSSVPIAGRFSLIGEAGAPALVREVRADGLTRSFVISASIRYHFK